jgi:hypothetical protein
MQYGWARQEIRLPRDNLFISEHLEDQTKRGVGAFKIGYLTILSVKGKVVPVLN